MLQARKIWCGPVWIIAAAMCCGCASVDRSKSPAEGARAALDQAGSGRAALPRHNLREWRLEIDTGGFVQLILSSSGYYMLRHGYFYADRTVGSDKTLMLSEVNIGKYVLRGSQVMMASPAKSTCSPRLGAGSFVVMETAGQSLVMDEVATRDFVFDEFKGRKTIPFLKQSRGTLDRSSALPLDQTDADGRFEARLGCVQMRENGQVAFTPPGEQSNSGAAPAAPTGVAH
jgi:hypothetical protein